MSSPLQNIAPGDRIAPAEIRELRRRLSPTPEKPLSQQQFSELLGVSWSTIARWESGARPEPHTARKLLYLQRALNALGEMVPPGHRAQFFVQEHPLLLNLRPIDLLENPKGAEAVLRLIEGAESGAFV